MTKSLHTASLALALTLCLTPTVAHASSPIDTESGHKTSYTLDNVLQYVPAAAAFTMNVAGVKSPHPMVHRTAMMGLSALCTAGVSEGLKRVVGERRPDGSDNRAFPSGHSAIAFMGAELLYQEYRGVSPWIWIGGYATATATAVLRVHHRRHYAHDVIAGAAIGVGCTKLVYWLYPKLVPAANRGSNQVSVVAAPFVAGNAVGCSAMVTF